MKTLSTLSHSRIERNTDKTASGTKIFFVSFVKFFFVRFVVKAYFSSNARSTAAYTSNKP